VFFRIWLFNAGILASNAARQLLLIGVSQIILYCVKRSTDVRKQESDRGFFLTVSKGGESAFFITVSLEISWLFKVELKQTYCSYLSHKKFRMVFNHFCYYFSGQYCCWTETKTLLTICLFIYKFPYPSTFILLPQPYRCFGVPEKEHEWKRSIAANKAQF